MRRSTRTASSVPAGPAPSFKPGQSAANAKLELETLIATVALHMGVALAVLEPLRTPREKCECLAGLAFEWAACGFPRCSQREQRLQQAHKAMISWAFPAGLATSRESAPAWHLLVSLSLVRGLRAVFVHQSRKHHLRVILRAAHPVVQATLLGLAPFGPDWRAYLRALFRRLWRPQGCPRL